MLYARRNFTDLSRLPKFLDGDVFEGCNFAQAEPDTPVATGAKALRFVRCNLVNCALPPDAVLEKSLHCQVPVSVSVETPEELAEGAEEMALAESIRESFQPQIEAAIEQAIADLRATRGAK